MTTTNPLSKENGVIKLNDVYKLPICKVNSLVGFDVEHNRFTFASSVRSHNTRFSKKMNFITKRPITILDLNCFMYLGLKSWSSVSDTFKNLKKFCF